MIRSIEDFTSVWTREAASTIQLFNALSDQAMPQAITPEHRDLGRLAWHITTTIREMMERTGLDVEGPAPDAPVPSSTEEIAREYARSSSSLLHALGAWNEASLDEVDQMYGEEWRRAFTLEVLILHQVHHRGQMTVLMRQAGLPVPGVYGPSKEDWAKWGMPAPAI